MVIDSNLQYSLSLVTSGGIPEATSNMIAHGSTEWDIYDMLDGCEWDAQAVSDVLNEASAQGKLYRHNWIPRRTLPRSIVVQGTDRCNNDCLLKLVLGKNEPNAFDGITLRLSLSNSHDIALATSNMIASGYNVEDVLDYLYECDWDAESFAAALNAAYNDGIIYNRNWTARRTMPETCVVEGSDSFGNVDILKIFIS